MFGLPALQTLLVPSHPVPWHFRFVVGLVGFPFNPLKVELLAEDLSPETCGESTKKIILLTQNGRREGWP